MKKSLLLLIFIMLIVGCATITNQTIQSMKLQKEAEAGGIACPSEKPYMIGGISGDCVDKDTFDAYIKAKQKGVTTDEEKELIISLKAKELGKQNNCPPEKPFYVPKYLGLSGDCVSEEDFADQKKQELEDWQESEKDNPRFVKNSDLCE